MTFPARAVKECVTLLKAGRVSEYAVRNVLKCRSVDVTDIEPFLSHPSADVRMAAVRIIGAKGHVHLLVELVKRETERPIIEKALTELGNRGKELVELVSLLESEDTTLKQAAIEMFRKSGNTDCLFALLFDRDEKVATQVKGYIDERDGRNSEARPQGKG